jgi:hypothetical protein
MLLWTHIDVNKILISFEDTICGQQGALKKNIFLKTLEFKSFKNTQLPRGPLLPPRASRPVNLMLSIPQEICGPNFKELTV